MKTLNKKRIQLGVLFIALALNTSWVQSLLKGGDNTHKAHLASVSIVSQSAQTSTCDEVKNERQRDDLKNIFQFKDPNLDLISLSWELTVSSYTCVKDGREEEMTSFDIIGNVDEKADSQIKSCSGQAGCAVNLNVSFERLIVGPVTENNLKDIAKVVNTKEQALKQHLANYKDNHKKVELDCTKSWIGDGTGRAESLNKRTEKEQIQACRREVLDSYGFETEKERYAYFKKYFYNRLREGVTSKKEDALEEVVAELNELKEGDSNASIRRDARKLLVLHHYTNRVFDLDSYYADAMDQCRDNTPSSRFSSDVVTACREAAFSEYRRTGQSLVAEASRGFAAGTHTRSSYRRAKDLFNDFQRRVHTMTSEHPGRMTRDGQSSSVIENRFSRDQARLILGRRGIVRKFMDKRYSHTIFCPYKSQCERT